MRPLVLTIAGLNSFRSKVTIDFEPLLRDGLFGIFGPTGSGKSTILDAITLALYGKVYRSSGSYGDIVNLQEKRCSVAFTFEIGADATGERYTVQRSLRRTKEGTTSGGNVRLIRHDADGDAVICDRVREVAEQMKSILGISIEDFHRTVVLPQGAFANFIGLPTKERSSAMQRLFNLEEFGAPLRSRLTAYLGELRTVRTELEGRLSELRPYDDDVVAESRSGLENSIALRERATVALRSAEEARRAAEELYALIGEHAALAARDDERESDEAELAQLRERLAVAERCAAVAPAIERLDAVRRAIDSLEADVRSCESELRRAEEIERTATAAFVAADEAFTQHDGRLDTEINRLQRLAEQRAKLDHDRGALETAARELADADEALVGSSEALEHTRKARVEIERRHQTARGRLEQTDITAEERARYTSVREAAQRLAAAEAQLAQVETGLRECRSEVDRCTAECERSTVDDRAAAARLSEIESSTRERRERRTAIAKNLEELRRAEEVRSTRLEEINPLVGSIDTHRRRVTTLLGEVDTLTKSEQERTREHERHRTALAEAERTRVALAQRREDLSQQFALDTAVERLRPGEPCPLCGSGDHPAPHHHSRRERSEFQSVTAELRQAEARVEAARTALEAARSAVDRVRVERENAERAIADGRSQLEGFEAQIRTLLEGGERSYASCEALEADRTSIRREREEVSKRLESTDREILDGEGALGRAQKIRTEAGNALVKARTRLEETSARAERLEHERTAVAAAVDSHRAAVLEASGQSSVDDARTWVRSVDERDAALTKLRRELDVLATERDEATRALSEATNAQQAAELRRNHLSESLERMRRDYTERADAHRIEFERIAEESERMDTIPEVTLRRIQLRAAIGERRNRAADAQSAAITERSVKAERAGSVRHRLEEHRTEAETARLAVEAALRENEFGSVEDVRNGAMTPAALRAMRDRVASLDRKLAAERERLAMLREKIGDRSISDEELSVAREAFDRADATCRQAIADEGGARERLQTAEAKNREYHALLERDAVGVRRLQTATTLNGYLAGDAFVNFLANERLARVCDHANHQLDTLTGGRLQIGTDPKDGFFINDNANGGVTRSTDTLSGGETFLVSLALALALSDTIQLGRAPLGFFFLDEGFGTLDSELLDAVMSSLERLRSEHRSIGVITHVQQMRERIPRRLIVEPADAAHGTRVRLESD